MVRRLDGEKVRELFKLGKSVHYIHKQVGGPKETIKAWVKKLRDNGPDSELVRPDATQAREDMLFRRWSRGEFDSLVYGRPALGSLRNWYTYYRREFSKSNPDDISFADYCEYMQMEANEWFDAKKKAVDMYVSREYTADEILAATGIQKSNVYQIMSRMRRKGEIEVSKQDTTPKRSIFDRPKNKWAVADGWRAYYDSTFHINGPKFSDKQELTELPHYSSVSFSYSLDKALHTGEP